MKFIVMTIWILALSVVLTDASPPLSIETTQQPLTFVYSEIDGYALNAYLFSPEVTGDDEQLPSILLFHGGGWVAGSAEWTFKTARNFAALGMVAISIEYRLSGDGVTPIEALADACAAFRWVREHADELSIDPDRVAGYGVSAGGQLVAAAATVGCPGSDDNIVSSKPDALLLWSPALDVASDGWFTRLLQGRASASDYSPVDHVDVSTPSASIVHGAEDTLTPLSGVERFCDRLCESGVVCDLNVYAGVGHLLTRNLANQESDFDPDPKARADGIEKHELFLRDEGFIPGE